MSLKYFLSLLLICLNTISFGQTDFTNRYSMKLEKRVDGSFTLLNRDKYSRLINLDSIPDLLVPYNHTDVKLSSELYNKTTSVEYTYKSYPGYDLKLIVDLANSDKPSPFMIYIHGGGWARGDNSSNSDISKYCAWNAGITGVRISYTLADKPDATILVTIQDVLDAVKWIKDNHVALNVNPSSFGFMGSSAGAHLSAIAAMSVPGTKVLIGVSGIYDLLTASISIKATESQRVKYFNFKDDKTLREASPVCNIPKTELPACYLIHGTADLTVEYTQTERFAKELKRNGIKNLKVDIFPNYDHNIGSKKSDLKELLFFKSYNFIKDNLK